MKAADIEWSMLRGGLIGLAIAIAVTATLIGVTYHFRDANEKDFQRADRDRRGAEQRYRELDEQELMIATYYPMFQDLERQGIIGDERRLKWTEALKQADESRKLPNLNYSIDAQALHKTEFPLAEGTYKVFASEMALDLGLLHGEDLFYLFNRLDEDAEGLYSVDYCKLTRIRDEPGSPKSPHLSTSCRLLWYTIKKPGAAS